MPSLPAASAVPASEPPAGGWRLRDRIDVAEAALRSVALARPNALALLEAGVERIGEALGAAVAAALVGEAHSDAYVRCAAWPPGAAPSLVELTADDWSGSEAGCVTVKEGGAVAEGLGHPHVLLLPVEGAVPGAFALGRSDPWTEAEQEAGTRLAALFSTLWAWSEAEARFQRAVADLDDTLFTVSYGSQGRRTCAFVTAQIEALTGLDPDAVLAGDADWADLVVEEDRDAFALHDARLQAGEPSRVDVRLRLEGGEMVWVCERATPGVDAAGRLGASGLLTDVTAQKEAEAQLDRARRVAERAAGARMAFLRTMSHELRTPLGVIRGFADLMQEEVAALEAAPPEISEFAGTIGEAAVRALRLVDDLLDLSRLETDALDLQSVPLDVGAVARHTAGRYEPDLEARGVAVRLEVPDIPVLAQGDPARVEQVVDQIVSNAARFTAEGAVVIRLAEEPEAVRLEIEDTGVGIADDVLESIFEPFVQEDARVNRAFEGTGLGLAIASRLAAQMGGRLEAQSAKGVGSTFTLWLPAAG